MLSCVAQPGSSKCVFEQLLDERGLPFRINIMKTRQRLETERLLWGPVFGPLLTPGHRPVRWYLRGILKTSGFFSVDSYTALPLILQRYNDSFFASPVTSMSTTQPIPKSVFERHSIDQNPSHGMIPRFLNLANVWSSLGPVSS